MRKLISKAICKIKKCFNITFFKKICDPSFKIPIIKKFLESIATTWETSATQTDVFVDLKF